MEKKKGSIQYKAFFISLALSAAILLSGFFLVEGFTVQRGVSGLLWPLGRLLIFICIGLAVGQVIEGSGWSKVLGALAAPLFRFGNLGNRCSAAFTTAFFSGVAANAMLLDFYKDDKISRRQLFLTNFINQFPAYFLHLPTTFFIVVSLTGLAGLLYFLLTFVATLFRTALFLLYGHLMTDKKVSTADEEPANKGRKRASGIWANIKARLPYRLLNIAVYVVPVYIFIFMINAMGFFTFTRSWMAEYVVTTFMPVEALSMVILSFAAEFTSGFAAAGALLEAGVLTTKQTVLALLIGNIVAFPVRAVRHQLPRYIGIFSPKMGTQLLLMGQGFRVASLIVVGIVYYLFF